MHTECYEITNEIGKLTLNIAPEALRSIIANADY